MSRRRGLGHRHPSPRRRPRRLHPSVSGVAVVHEMLLVNWSAPSDLPRIVPGNEGIRYLPFQHVSDTLRPPQDLRPYLQDSKLVHFLPLTRRDHVLPHSDCLIHLRPPSPLDQAVCSLSGDLATRCCCTRVRRLPFIASFCSRCTLYTSCLF